MWVSTCSSDGDPYLVPLSLAWLDDRVVIAAEFTSRTVRNLEANRRARVGVGPTRDVVLLDVEVERIEVAGESALLAGYTSQADWTPPADYAVITLRPTRIQAWREANEIPGRTLMRAGSWV
jgi:hypothetical protein